MFSKIKLSSLILGATLMLGLGVTSAFACPDSNSTKCGASKCGDMKKASSKCGSNMKAKKCPYDKSVKPAAKCGTGKCGDMKAKKCPHAKSIKPATAKCGSKCGSK